MRSFLHVTQGKQVPFRLSRAEWEALPFVDEAAAPRHLQVFRDRERFGLVYRWLGGADGGCWWMANVTVDDGQEPAPAPRRRPLKDLARAALPVRWRRG